MSNFGLNFKRFAALNLENGETITYETISAAPTVKGQKVTARQVDGDDEVIFYVGHGGALNFGSDKRQFIPA